ncbi:hypothetical protein FIBSPDRAFT_1053953 [Athelia psychrophila]|uniref:Uncharacterized protein n=1 Tax=Athelia psychrophila TaxID=1759441 RepID=A0A167W5A2_9AGAM|nr:hypothetical protein FIBSPDRAFT_1053953 [Fibularhizoctonia sp. CBS 109695]
MYPPDYLPQSTDRNELRSWMQSDWIINPEQADSLPAYMRGFVEGANFLQSTHLPEIVEWIGNVEEDSRDMDIQMAYMCGFVEGASSLPFQPTMQAASSVVAESSSGAPAHPEGAATISSPVRIFCNDMCGRRGHGGREIDHMDADAA